MKAILPGRSICANRQRCTRTGFVPTTPGAPREGAALLQGLVWCGCCGAKMSVNSYSVRDQRRPSYFCKHAYTNGAAHTCQSMTSQPIDELVVVALFFDALAPAQLEIASRRSSSCSRSRQALQQQWEQQLEQARYEVQLAQRQYDAVDPDYRLVAAELERRWNDKLDALQKLETAYTEAQHQAHFSVSADEQQAMNRLAQDLPAVWQAPTTTDRERKQLLRYAIAEVQLDGVSTPGKIDIRVTWWSGAVTQAANRPAQGRLPGRRAPTLKSSSASVPGANTHRHGDCASVLTKKG